MSVQQLVFPTPAEAARACAERIGSLLDEAISSHEPATLAVSGGTTARPLFERLATQRIAWDRVHLFWVDERSVPPGDTLSNYGLAEQVLIRPARIPRRNVHRVPGELAPEAAARAYADEIRSFFGLASGEMPRFDVVHQGMGADGHTASLFPGEPLIDDREGIAAAVHVAKLEQWRATLLPGVLRAARNTVFLAAGADKARAVRAVLGEPHDPKKYPAQIASERSVEWFLDRAAALALEEG
jgi:6-phosphogluconolactonase